MTEVRRRNPIVTAVLIAFGGLAIAVLLGWGLMSIGANRLAKAEKTREPLRYAVSYIATEGVSGTRAAGEAVAASNWGEAQQQLTQVNVAVTALERAKSDENGVKVDRVRRALGEAQTAVGQQKGEAREAIEEVRGALEGLQVQ